MISEELQIRAFSPAHIVIVESYARYVSRHGGAEDVMDFMRWLNSVYCECLACNNPDQIPS